MADLTLNEYRDYPEEKLKEILSKEKGLFSSGISHEIKTPVYLTINLLYTYIAPPL